MFKMNQRLWSKEKEDVIRERDKLHRIISWCVQSKVNPKVIAKTDGCYLWDAEGNKYFDMWSQLCYLQIGFNNQEVINAIKKQAEELCVLGPNFTNEATSGLAELLCELAPGDLNKVFFTGGGAEANENAIRMARLYTEKTNIVTRFASYHGATLGALSASGDPRRKYIEPRVNGFIHVPDCYCYRCPFEKEYPACDILCARHIEKVIEVEGNVAAVLLETIVGSNGLLVPPVEYLQIVREICNRHGALLILDEVMAGIGRSGKWFACEHYDVTPDLLTCAKAITSGYIPVGAVLLSKKVSDYFQDRYLPCGLTFSSHPMGCAAGLAALKFMKKENLVERGAALGNKLKENLERLKSKHLSVGDVRCKGLWSCLELVKNQKKKTPLNWADSEGKVNPMKEISQHFLKNGYLPRLQWNLLLVGPPLIATDEELTSMIEAIDGALEIADRFQEE
jgi:taurine---2-oxoglutarate transaminase